MFKDLSSHISSSILNSVRVKVYSVVTAFSIYGVSFAVGDLLIGFNDGFKGDKDFDDMILKASTHATPIPGAAWLLGSGLVGLVGLRRRFQG